MKGVLAAEAARGIATMYQNYLNKAEGVGVLRLEPPDLVSVPPLRVYTHIQVARKITVRDVVGDEPAAVKKLRDKANAKAKANTEKPAPVADDDDDDGRGKRERRTKRREACKKVPTYLQTTMQMAGRGNRRRSQRGRPRRRRRRLQLHLALSRRPRNLVWHRRQCLLHFLRSECEQFFKFWRNRLHFHSCIALN